MKRIRYSAAMSLDGYIAGPRGEFDWIVQNPEVEFGALYRQFEDGHRLPGLRSSSTSQ